MQRAQPRLARPAPPDTRIVTLAVAALALLLLAVSVYYLNEFRLQRGEARRNAELLTELDEQLLTATPAAQEAAYLESQLSEAQNQFGEASGDLPSSDINEDAVFERISEAARLSGVNLLTTSQSGSPTQEGNLVYKYYSVAAAGDLERLNNFTSRLEEEAFPTAYFSEDATLTINADGSYTLTGTLTIPTYTTSTGDISNPSSIPTGNSPEALRALAADAMTRRDYELAISYLLRLAATNPPPADINDLLYEAYIAYGNDLLSRGLAAAAQEQCLSAQAFRPDSPDAAACLLTAAQMVTATPGGTGGVAVVVTATPDVPSPTVTSSVPTETPTLQPTVELPPTRTPPPPTNPPPPETNTPVPTFTLTPTPTVTGTPPTATPEPTATFSGTGGGDGFAFGPLTPVYLPNCGLTQVKGTIRDARTNATLNGVTVRVWWDGAPDNEVYSLPSGTDPTKGGGEWDVVLWPGPKVGRWYVQVVDRTTGAPLSQRVTVETDVGPCGSGGAGRQVVIQDFFRYGGVVGTIVPSATPSVGPSTTGTPTVTFTPSNTGTPTNTPTVTPTPTSTYVAYSKDEDPNLDIPDGPDGRVTSNLVIGDNLQIRQLNVFPVIEHQDVSDLDIFIIHPDGTRIQIHAQGQDAGQTSLRRRIAVTGADLERIAGKSIQGTWQLEVVDRVEAKTGQLFSWSIEVFP